MDPRAELLIDELSTHPKGQSLDFPFWRERFQSLFDEELDDASRQVLLQAYSALLDLVERALVAGGGDPQAFKDARRADWNHLCLQEALQRSGTDLFQPDDLNEIVQREVAAGRMEEGSFSQFAADGAAVLGCHEQASGPQKGFFRRLFS